MLPGLTKDQFRDTLFSVGHAHLKRRPLSPVEVAVNFKTALDSGASKSEISTTVQLTDTTMVARFLRLLTLDPKIRHLVDWGTTNSSAIGFSTAVELSRIEVGEQSLLAPDVLRHRMTKKEMVSIVQLRGRSGQELDRCVQRVIGRRPVPRSLELVSGAITLTHLVQELSKLSQRQRDQILREAISDAYPEVKGYASRLGVESFTIVGGKEVKQFIGEDEEFEPKITNAIELKLGDQEEQESSNGI